MSRKEAKSSTETRKPFEDYFNGIISSLSTMQEGSLATEIDVIIDSILKAHRNSKTIFIFGNGGSASTASHFCCDLSKGTIANLGEKRLKVFSLNDSIPLITAWANDTEYANIFVEQLKNLVEKGDVVIGISGSGCSCNVLEAVKCAKEKGAYTIGLTGMKGGVLKDMVDVAVVVPSDIIQQVEDIHLILCHMIALLIREEMKEVQK